MSLDRTPASVRTDRSPEILVETLRARIRPERTTYHAFEYRGRRMVYDLWSGSLLDVRPGAFALLAALERDATFAELEAEVVAAEPAADLAALAREVEHLAGLGFFALEHLDTDAEIEGRVQSYLRQPPNKMMLLVQTSCNLACTYCYEVTNGFHKNGGTMDLETAKRSVEFLIRRAEHRPELEITFFGGEPLMAFRRVREVVDYCRSREAATGKTFAFKMTTNATLMTDEIVRYLVEQRFVVMISLDGDPAAADSIRVDLKGRGTTERAVANAKKLVAAQRAAGLLEASIRATMAPGNHSLTRIKRYLEAQGFQRIVIGAAMGRAHEKGPKDLGPNEMDQLAAEFEGNIQDHVDWLEGRAGLPQGENLNEALRGVKRALKDPAGKGSVGCGVGRNMTAIAADGKLYPCHRYAGETKYELGTLEQGIDVERLRSYYREILKGYQQHCSHCWARFACGGQCAWYLSRPDGHVGSPDEDSCNRIRSGLEKRLWLFNETREVRARRPTTDPASKEDPDDCSKPT